MKKIGIIGQGFVGNAVYQTMKHWFDILTYDKDPNKYSNVCSIEQMAYQTNIIFICLPTPMKKNGSCDLSIITSVIDQLNKLAERYQKTIISVVKSTVPPGTTKYINDSYDKVKAIFNPEFLTEANAENDFRYQNRIILGGEIAYTSTIKELYEVVFPDTPIVMTDASTAELVKYVTNIFLSIKVSFANQMYQLCQYLHIDYNKLIQYATLDQRLGQSH